MERIKIRRPRGKNFCETDKEKLLEIVSAFKAILDNKKTDQLTSNLKTEAWDKITVRFNSCNPEIKRTGFQLKGFYENFKAKLRKRYSLEDSDKQSDDRKQDLIVDGFCVNSNNGKLTVEKRKLDISDGNTYKVYEILENEDPLLIDGNSNPLVLNNLVASATEESDSSLNNVISDDISQTSASKAQPVKTSYKRQLYKPRLYKPNGNCRRYNQLKYSILKTEHEERIKCMIVEREIKEEELKLMKLKVKAAEVALRTSLS